MSYMYIKALAAQQGKGKKGKGKGKRVFVKRLVVNTPLRRSGIKSNQIKSNVDLYSALSKNL